MNSPDVFRRRSNSTSRCTKTDERKSNLPDVTKAQGPIRSQSMNSKFPRNWKRRTQRNTPNARRLPDRWLDYDPVGKDIPGTRFVAFKTPLRSDYFVNRGEMFDSPDIFEVKTLLNMASAQGKRLGLVIDLTATDRYYDPQEWIDNGVKYEKIWCMGHEAHTQLENVQKFYDIVSEFLRENVHTGALIGVHCTHGLNRTGYMICRYLVEVDGWGVDRAVEQFEYCRGYEIERKKYIDSLLNECTIGKYAALSVDYPEKHEKSIEKVHDHRLTRLRSVLPCVDLNEFVASC